MAHIDTLTLVNAAQLADTDNLYVGRPGDVDPDRRTLLSSLAEKIGDVFGNGSTAFYEEDSFTPTVTGAGTPPTVSYSTQVGRFVRIGRLVTVECRLAFSSISGGSGGVRIGGLPYPCAAAAANLGSLALHLAGTPWPSNRTQTVAFPQVGETAFGINAVGSSQTASAVLVTDFSTSTLILLGGTYICDLP